MFKETGKLKTKDDNGFINVVCSKCNHESKIETSSLINYKCIRCGGVLVDKKVK
jgi:ribosomal protein S27E